MSESEGQRSDSPLLTERGATIISSTVVSSIAGMAAQEVEGVHMGGGASRTASGVLGSITGSESKTGGISVEVGRTETALDLKMGIEYNQNILQTVEEVRRRVTERVEGMTGLRIKELNATITDITFPEKQERRRLGSGRSASEREVTEVEPTSRTHTEGESGPVPEEEVGVDGRPLEEGETMEVRTDDTQIAAEPTSEASEADTRAEPSEEAETRAGNEISERDDAEARMRRRAEERARRRRRRTEDS